MGFRASSRAEDKAWAINDYTFADGMEPVSPCFVKLMLWTVTRSLFDYVDEQWESHMIENKNGTRVYQGTIPNYWHGDWKLLARKMCEPESEITETRIRNSWKVLGDLGFARCYVDRYGQQSYQITLGYDDKDYTSGGKSDTEIFDAIETAITSQQNSYSRGCLRCGFDE